jgi:6-pyruvoyltetrahydropterin/6-carboxytetrahydropterin synthase
MDKYKMKDNCKYQSTKVFNGYSTAFRQWKSKTHCKYLHGYSLSFKVTFQSELDQNNWVFNFGGFKKVKKYLSNTFDHTTVISADDPNIDWFEEAHSQGILQLIILESVGCEKFAEYIFNVLKRYVDTETKGRVSVIKVECFEDGANNSAIYKRFL